MMIVLLSRLKNPLELVGMGSKEPAAVQPKVFQGYRPSLVAAQPVWQLSLQTRATGLFAPLPNFADDRALFFPMLRLGSSLFCPAPLYR